jgi:nitronate monooxygenase/enoyl-[acyl-carrier protein] reductase II
MLRTRFCDLVDVEVPIVQAPVWPATAPELVASVCEAGALGSVGALLTPAEDLIAQIEEVRRLTARPFAVNHVVPSLDEEAFAATLAAAPAVISFALGDPGDLVARAQETGARVMQQVHTVAQAQQAATRGVDVVIAQGSEAGGQGPLAGVGCMALVPQVVDAVGPIPVLAAGGVADGRGLAAALALGAAGVNVGTRFLASVEAGVADGWKRAVVEAASEDVVRFEPWAAIMPSQGGYDVVPRLVRTAFVDEWRGRAGEAAAHAEALREQIFGAFLENRAHELTPLAGQTAGLVRDVRPAGEIVRAMAAQAAEVLARDAALAV